MDSVYMFYEFHARRGVGMDAQLEQYRPARPGDYAGFLAGVADGSVKERPTRLKEEKRRPATLSNIEVQQILDESGAKWGRLRCERHWGRRLVEAGYRMRAGAGEAAAGVQPGAIRPIIKA